MLNDHGQPKNRYLRANQVLTRDIDELIGICKGVIADNLVVQAESEFLLQWLQTHRDVAQSWPANVLYQRLIEMLADGILQEEEQVELLALLKDFTGGKLSEDVASATTSLPLSQPPPPVEFEGRTFVLTGKFLYGTRKQCENEVYIRSGVVDDRITQRTDYLVLGVIGSRDWLHSTYGTKIMAAVELRDQGLPLAIVSEHHWMAHLR